MYRAGGRGLEHPDRTNSLGREMKTLLYRANGLTFSWLGWELGDVKTVSSIGTFVPSTLTIFGGRGLWYDVCHADNIR